MADLRDPDRPILVQETLPLLSVLLHVCRRCIVRVRIEHRIGKWNRPIISALNTVLLLFDSSLRAQAQFLRSISRIFRRLTLTRHQRADSTTVAFQERKTLPYRGFWCRFSQLEPDICDAREECKPEEGNDEKNKARKQRQTEPPHYAIGNPEAHAGARAPQSGGT